MTKEKLLTQIMNSRMTQVILAEDNTGNMKLDEEYGEDNSDKWSTWFFG